MNSIKLDFSSDIYQFGEDISAARLHAKLFNVISSKINIIVNTEGNKKLDENGHNGVAQFEEKLFDFAAFLLFHWLNYKPTAGK